MAELPTVASLWIGGTLTWVERLSLKSFVDKGHHTVLYTYEPVEGVPEGVEVRDGSTIADIASMPRHGRTGSPALFSDLFRYHMMVKAPGEIWIDTDMLCWQPLEGLGDHVFGYEAPHQLNGAILRLPPDSEALGQLLEFTKDEYSIADFLSDEMKMDYAEAAQTGAPVHVSEQPWGIWGPLALTHFLKKTGEARFAERELHKKITEMPDELGLVVLVVSVEGYSYKEAAELLDIPVGTVMSRLHRARKQLAQDMLEPLGVTS